MHLLTNHSHTCEAMANFFIQQMRERRINKFNINGFDYKVKVNMTTDDITYAEAWQNLHNVLSGKFLRK